jgi:hypothetical protein
LKVRKFSQKNLVLSKGGGFVESWKFNKEKILILPRYKDLTKEKY